MAVSFRALGNRNYRLFFYGQLASMVGTWMQGTVQAWLVYQISHSAAWLGIITFCSQATAFFFSPLAGAMADRFDRRTILMWVESVGMLQAFLLAALVLSGKVELWHIAGLSVLLGVVSAFEITTRHAFAYDLVGINDLHSAIACNSITVNASRIIGPAIAGVLLVPLGEGWCFVLNGISFLAILTGLALMKMHHRQSLGPTLENPLKAISKAVRYIRNSRRISLLIALSAFISFVGFPYQVLLPVFAKEYLHGDARTLGFLIGATGFGAIVGAFYGIATNAAGQIESRISASFLGIALALILLGSSTVLPFSLLATFGIGYFLMGIYPALNTTIQSIAEDSMRGRILSLYTMSFLGAMPLGSLCAGWLADRYGAKTVELACGAVFLLSAIAFHCFSGSKWLNWLRWARH